MAGVLDMILGGLQSAMRNSTVELEKCNACDEPALPLACVICGERTCLKHAWVSCEVLVKRTVPRVVCSRCVEDIEIEDEDGEPVPRKEQARWQEPAKPANVDRERKEWARKVLAVTAQSTRQEIAAAYREKARKYHPDHNPGDPLAEAAFKQATEAYDILRGKAG